MSDTKPAGIRIGGVPEHFNLPWHLVLESGAPPADGARWRDYSTGTGAMLADLAAGELDIAILLTEGAALGLARGLPVEAVSLYTTSPLIWGIHVPPAASWRTQAELKGRRFAISRSGSGSHLMSLALAIDNGWPVGAQSYVVVDDLPGAVAAFAEGRADVFLWEHFTTEPWVESGDFRRLGDFVSPWPAWVVCVNTTSLERNGPQISALMRTVMRAASELKQSADAAARIARRYGLRETAVRDWLGRTEWVDAPTAPQAALAAATRMLETAGAIEPARPRT